MGENNPEKNFQAGDINKKPEFNDDYYFSIARELAKLKSADPNGLTSDEIIKFTGFNWGHFKTFCSRLTRKGWLKVAAMKGQQKLYKLTIPDENRD